MIAKTDTNEAVGDELAEEALAAAEAVTTALLAGRDTTAARARMARARAAFEAHQARVAKARGAADARRSAEVAARARALAAEAQARLQGAADAIPMPDTAGAHAMTPATATIDEATTVELRNATTHLARAERALADAEAVAREAHEAEQSIRQRIAALDAKRAEIGQRRAAGATKSSDGGELETIALDREGLAALLGDAAAKASAAREATEQRRRVADSAREALARIEAAARRDHFARQADALAAALLSTIAEMNSAGKIAGDRVPAWAVPEALKQRARELEFKVLR